MCTMILYISFFFQKQPLFRYCAENFAVSSLSIKRDVFVCVCEYEVCINSNFVLFFLSRVYFALFVYWYGEVKKQRLRRIHTVGKTQQFRFIFSFVIFK